MNPELQRAIDQWLKWDQDTVTKGEIQKLVDENNVDELSKLLTPFFRRMGTSVLVFGKMYFEVYGCRNWMRFNFEKILKCF